MQECGENSVRMIIENIISSRGDDFSWVSTTPTCYDDEEDSDFVEEEPMQSMPNSPTLETLNNIRCLCDTIQTNIANSDTMNDSFLMMGLMEVENKLKEFNDTLNSLMDYNNNQAMESALLAGDLQKVADNIWNQYNTEICRQRVAEFVDKTITRLARHGVKRLHIMLLGDAAHGAIHNSCRVASEEDTCDQLMQVSELMAEAINELSNYVPEVNVYATYGNHLRTVQNKNDSIHSDNMERIIPWWLEQRLQKNARVSIVKSDYYEFIYEIFYKHGKRDWENDDYIWLQNAGEEYEKYRLTPYAEMNIAAEEMYHLGKDGRLYQDPGCEGTYDIVFDEITDQEDIDYFRKQIEKSLRKE